MLEAEQHLEQLPTRILTLREDIGKIDEQRWKWLLMRRLGRVTNLASLVQVYRSRQHTIAELDGLIFHTDDLIDQIVYALYGLSPEDIAAVEQPTLPT